MKRNVDKPKVATLSMNNESQSLQQPYTLIDQFYQLLRIRRFGEIESVITQLHGYAAQHREFPLWAEYFAGILAEERDRNWAKAEAQYALVLDAKPEPLLTGHVWLSLGIAQKNQARWAESVLSCDASATLWKELGYPIKQAVALRQLAISLQSGYDLGEFGPEALERATTLCQTALANLASDELPEGEIFLYQPNIPLYRAYTWLQLGNVYRCRADWQAAIQCYQKTLELCTTLDNQQPAGFAYTGLGDIYQLDRSQANSTALPFYEKALHCYRHYADRYREFGALARIGKHQQNQGDLGKAKEYYDQAITMIEQVRSGAASEEARMGFFATAVNIYDNAILTQLQAKQMQSAFDYMERARSRAFLDKLTGGNMIFTAQIESAVSSLAELQAKLGLDTLLLEYYTTGLLKAQSSEQQAANNVLYPSPKTLLFAVTTDNIAVFDLGLSPNTLFTNSQEQRVEERFLSTSLRRKLYQVLIAPITDWLKGKKRLYLIPHGPLHYVPFHALLDDQDECLLHAEGPEIIYAPSATILFRPQPAPNAPPSVCLAIGYNGEGATQLRFAEEEAAYIARMAGGTALVGSSSKKVALYQQAPYYQALHFSCHGEFDPDAPLESMLHIGPGETLTGQEIIDHLRLNCSLVTLSACESGLSKVQRGDELYGLLRAFMYAGAPAIIATLWRVDERSTLIFAEKFYQLEQQGFSYAAALKAAQLYLKNLTRPEALAILMRYLSSSTGQPPDDQSMITQPSPHQKGFAPSGAAALAELLPPGADDDQPFAAPQYWAPFVLVGGPQSGERVRE
jgi:CHAT domain-containing protein